MSRIGKMMILLVVMSPFFTVDLNAQEVKNGLTWYTDVNKASEISNKSKKPIFAFFTGSDWCGWCTRLQRNVFEKPGFQDWAKKNVILLELDFPRSKKLPDEIVNQNAGLQQFFSVQGYPTIWMFFMTKDKKTNKQNIAALGSLGYPQSQQGQEEMAFLANANAVLSNKDKK